MTPPNQLLVDVAGWLLLGAFVGYVAATILYASGIIGTRMTQGTRFTRNTAWAGTSHLVGVIFHALAILARWQGAGHWPTSNMYEFIGFMAFTSMVAFQVINAMYRLPFLGAILSPVGVFMLAYAYVFPPKVAPLVPALRSYWLPMHVSTAALGEGFFAVAFGAALLYLLRMRGLELSAVPAGAPVPPPKDRGELWGQRALEILFYLILVMVGFTILALTMRWTGHQWIFDGVTYHLPPIIGPAGGGVGTKGSFLGMPLPLMEPPFNWRGKNWNTLVYSLAVGGILYGVLRLLLKERLGDALARRVGGDPELMDEVSYRAVAIGYPVFTLGGLIFAMLWAKQAWGRYWFFDPKETWALIAWLVYSAYLHFRITQGWGGKRSAWLAVIGFGVVLFTLVGVNLLIVGLHSYAGGDM